MGDDWLDRLKEQLGGRGPEHPLEPPALRVLGKYELLAPIGRGGAGVVYRARDRELGRTVALKLLRDSEFASPAMVERFRREAELAGRLRHPNIVTVHDVGEVVDASISGPVRYIAMDFIPGPMLADEIPRLHTKWREIAGIAEKIARAMHFAHENGIVHRDLKPQNVILDGRGEPVVTDFGLAKEIDSTTGVTKTGSVIGTPFYMAPEQVRGESKDVDARTDVYAIGILLYELLAGTPPFLGSTATEIYSKILNDEPKPLADAPRELSAIAFKAMAKERPRRYPSARDLGDDLRRWLSGEPILARPPSVLYRLKRKLLRHRVLLTGLVASLAATAIVAAILIHYTRTRAFEQARNDARRAHEASDWPRVRDACERGLAVREEPELRRMLDVALARLADAERARKDVEERRAASARAAPILVKARSAMEAGERYFYVAGGDLTESFRQFDQAAKFANQALQEDPDNAEAYLLLGRACYRRSMDDEAERHLARAIELQPKLAPAYYYRVRVLLGRFIAQRGATNYFLDGSGKLQRVPAVEPPAAIETKNRIREDLRTLESLPHSKEEGLSVSLLLAFADQLYDDLKNAKDVRDVPEAHEILYVVGLAMLDSGDPSAAAAKFEEVLKLCPNHYLARFYLGVARFEMRRDAEGEKHMAEAMKPLNRTIHLRHHRALLRMCVGNLEGALADYQSCIDEDPNFALGYSGRAICRHQLGRPGAEEDFLRYVDLAPQEPRGWANLGLFYLQTRRFEDAIRAFLRAEELDRLSPEIPSNRATALEALGRLPEALDAIEEVVRRAPKAGMSWAQKGDMLQKLNRLDAALEAYQRAVELDPKCGEWHMRVGVMRAILGDFEKAAKDFDESIRLDPGLAMGWFNRGNIYFNEKEHEKAIEHYTKAIELDATLMDAYRNRGISRVILREYDKAVADLEKALAASPEDQEIRRSLGDAYFHVEKWKECIATLEKLAVLDDYMKGHLDEARRRLGD